MSEIVAFTHEGAELLDDFSNKMLLAIDKIMEESKLLQKTVLSTSAIGDDTFDIMQRIEQVIKKINDKSDSINELATRMKKKAEEIHFISEDATIRMMYQRKG